MKKYIFFLSAFCLMTTISFAGGPDQPIQLKSETHTQMMLKSAVNEVTLSIVQPKQVLISDDACIDWGVQAAFAEALHYGDDWSDHNYMMNLSREYVRMCDAAGGPEYMLDPVFL